MIVTQHYPKTTPTPLLNHITIFNTIRYELIKYRNHV